ncbi:hypothetical protein, partial [Bradyrhizobium canariense]|uniref:hypothetical protein n=1 Tax=Bradyrhizobium canariense TaxID=255045 RepID=UPI001A7E1C17
LQMRIRRLIPLCASGIAPSPPAFLESAAFSIFSILIFDFFEGLTAGTLDSRPSSWSGSPKFCDPTPNR